MMRAGRPLSALEPNASPFHALGAEIRKRRERAGFIQEHLAMQVGASHQHISALERGRERPSPPLIKALDRALNADGALVKRYRVAIAEHHDRQHRETPDVDRRHFLQVGAGAGLGLVAAGLLGQQAAGASDLTGAFQQITLGLRRLDDLRGSAAVMPVARQHLGLALDAVKESRAPAVRAAAADVGQLCGWLAFDQGQPDQARRELRQAGGLARAAGDQSLGAYIVAHLSILDIYSGDPGRAADLASAASRNGTRATAGVRSWLETVSAEAHAAAGDELAARNALDHAERDLDLMAPGEDPAFMYHYGRDGLTMVMGSVYLRLGQPGRAREAIHETIRLSAPGVVREQAVYGAQLARAFALEGEVDEAVRLALTALEVASRTGSARGVERVRQAREVLDSWAGSRPVRELDEQLAAVAPQGE